MITTSTPMIVPISPRFIPHLLLQTHHAVQTAFWCVRKRAGGGNLPRVSTLPADGTAKFSVSTGVMRTRPTGRVFSIPKTVTSDQSRRGFGGVDAWS